MTLERWRKFYDPNKNRTLLEGRKVEQNRIEYKEGFNPSEIVHTIWAMRMISQGWMADIL